MAKPIASGSAGWDVPSQPRRNSSINFAMDLSLHVISESKLWPSIGQNRRFPEHWRPQPWHVTGLPRLAPVPCCRDSVTNKTGICDKGETNGTAGRQGGGDHGR